MAGASGPGDQPALVSSQGGRGRLRRLLVLVILLLPVSALCAENPGPDESVATDPVSIKVERVTAGRSGNWTEIGIEVRVGVAGKGLRDPPSGRSRA